MMQNKLIIGLTGGSGSGKSKVSQQLEQLGCFVIDADKIAKDIMKPGLPAYNSVVDYFGEGIVLGSGMLDRKKLASIVFSDEKELKMLNTITHKYIKAEIEKLICASENEIIVIDAAVIIGSNMQDMCDIMISVLADRDTRLERIMTRDGITRDMAAARIASQPDDNFYIAHSDYFVYNNDLAQTNKEIDDIFRRILIGRNKVQNKK